MADELSQDEVLALLLESSSSSRGPKSDPTEPRIAATWIRLVNALAEPCENPDCQDPRPLDDKGRLVTVIVKNKRMCRYCFLDGWLSNG